MNRFRFKRVSIVTIVNVVTKQCRAIWVQHPEELDEIELDENEQMFVNTLEENEA